MSMPDQPGEESGPIDERKWVQEVAFRREEIALKREEMDLEKSDLRIREREGQLRV